MARETYAFEGWLRSLRTAIEGKETPEALEIIGQSLLERFGARVWFAEILGKRWSYITGCGGDFPIPLEQIPLTPRFGLVIEAWGSLSPGEKECLLAFLQDLLSQRSAFSGKRES